MLNQIELYRKIPDIRKNINGFIDETRARLFDCSTKETGLRRKYSERLKHAELAKESLANLQRCLNE